MRDRIIISVQLVVVAFLTVLGVYQLIEMAAELVRSF